MSSTLLFVLLSWISVIPCPSRAQDGGRELYFPAYYFYAEKHFANHLIKTMIVKDLDECEYRCYLDPNCVSLNIKNKDPNGTHECELNNSTHLEDEMDLKHNQLYYYRGTDHNCRKNRQECENNSTCQSGFTQKGYRCLCTAGFEGEHCEKDIDECDRGSHNCHSNAACNNSKGGYNCSCIQGYTGDGQNCTDIDECAQGDPCNTVANSVCKNTNGSYNCQCKDGFEKNGDNCKDECNQYKYINLTEADRKYGHGTGSQCDHIPNGWYRFQGDAGSKMMTTCPLINQCGAKHSAWLSDGHPTVAEGIVLKKICMRESNGHNCCKEFYSTKVKNCGLYFIYELLSGLISCPYRYCSTD